MHLRVVAPGWAVALVSDLTDMDRSPRRVAPGEVVEFDVPDDAYLEYGFVDASGAVRPDPAGGERAKSVWYGEVSCVTGPAYRRPDLADPPAELARGVSDRLRLESAALGQVRRATVYTPAAVAPDEPTPLLVVQDGVAFQRVGGLHLSLEALLGRGEVLPARVAFVEPVDRTLEYQYCEPFLRFVAEELEPVLAERYPLTGRRVFVGASLGGLASAQLALRRAERDPEAARSDAVVTLSGAFLGAADDREPYRSRASWLVERLQDPEAPVAGTWYLHVGTLEWLHAVNRQAAEALRARAGVRVHLMESSAGHNWRNWKDALPAALRTVLAPG